MYREPERGHDEPLAEMRPPPILASALRVVAIVIAIAALIDPAVRTRRATTPVVALVAGDGQRDSLLADEVDRAIGKSFVVLRTRAGMRVPDADATVLAGDAPPVGRGFASPAFAIFHERHGPTVTLDAVHAPAWTSLDARAPITIDARVTGARGATLALELLRGGLVVDQATRPVADDDERVSVSVGFMPTALGAAPLRVVATLQGRGGAGSRAAADLVVDVRDRRWAVLFYDPRPSWMSTFARRALERDQRFVVTSRVVTSRGVSTDAGGPPRRLDDRAALERYDVVVVGAPDALAAADVSGLEAYLRRRGGSVVLLFDRRASGPYERLAQAGAWSVDSSGKAATITLARDGGALRASEFMWPTRLPDGAEPIAVAGAARPVVWRSPVGAGQLIVSGALDAWRFRDRSSSEFDRFWQTQIAAAAAAAPPAIDLGVANGAIAPGRETEVVVVVRDAALSDASSNARATVSATLAAEPASTMTAPVRLWPGATPGEFRGLVRADAPGSYRLVVTSGEHRAEMPIMVSADVSHPSAEAHDLLAAWAVAHGGRALPSSDLDQLASALRAAIQPAPGSDIWHPMRSAWLIVPFALALSGEWWLRRRRGLP